MIFAMIFPSDRLCIWLYLVNNVIAKTHPQTPIIVLFVVKHVISYRFESDLHFENAFIVLSVNEMYYVTFRETWGLLKSA